MKLSVVIPARNEEGSIEATIRGVSDALRREEIDHEILVVDDSSTDLTRSVIAALSQSDSRVLCIASPYRNGFGFAVRAGLERYTGDAVAIMMADGSDSPEDLVVYHRLLEAGYDCVLGSRFIEGRRTQGYPLFKLVVNRIVNLSIRMLLGHGYDDTTNAFKAYRREVIDNVQPLISQHFNLTVELPLKAIVRGHSYAVTPISWVNRTSGTSKLHLQEMGSRYLFIVLYALLEHHLSGGDYRRSPAGPGSERSGWRAGSPALRVRLDRTQVAAGDES
jgi:dolichol-phosphate mannosyltransferase